MENVRWTLWHEGGVHSAHFVSKELMAWVTRSAVIVYDLPERKGYAAIYSVRHDLWEGELRQISVGETVYAPDHTEWLWMNAEEKEKMNSLLRRVISFRQSPLPEPYAGIWKDGMEQVRTLVIQNAGQVKYPAKWIPGLG